MGLILTFYWKLLLSYIFVRRCINFCWILFKVCVTILILSKIRIFDVITYLCYKCYSFVYCCCVVLCTILDLNFCYKCYSFVYCCYVLMCTILDL